MVPPLNHVAILVRSALSTANVCEKLGYELGPVEDFPGEGTREVYVGAPNCIGRLLLMEAVGPGPYRAALEKRGPGLHHVAIDVGPIEDYVAGLSGSGWLLHPASLRTLTEQKAVYLARPGLKVLIEVQESSQTSLKSGADRFISEISVAGDPSHQDLLDALGVPGINVAEEGAACLIIGGKRVAVGDLLRD